jgi:hypothetical protein
VKSGAVEKADLRETLELFSRVLGGDGGVGEGVLHWMDLAREFGRVMRKA